MIFNTTTIFSAVALLMAGQVFGVAIDTSSNEARDVLGALIAPDPTSACNCPNNCSHHAGSSCKYCENPNNTCKTVSGTCEDQNGTLICVAS
ncbi:uncharacterized protein F4822DRAFT_192425 [Hypoxylon trugodes]|uniref:uncharacterized protein n=1 Tax=Hypoxylon trugodes TaxID=326681 RepID=UPI00219C1350|nr:uncharacterized protein F4822DRAFT_192425 [Hypoxylon trugodes]KAI1391655.1 hypothetical protein F4822DRAFT_192425 [Hypoxylon trugodes]